MVVVWRFLLGVNQLPSKIFTAVEFRASGFVLLITILLPIIIFLTSQPALSQKNISIQGYIFDEVTGRSIPGATIELAATGFKTNSDDFGRYILENIPAGDYSIRISAVGYNDSILKQINVIEDITCQLNIRLTKKIYELGKIVVTSRSDNFAHSQLTVLSRSDINRAGAGDIAELLEEVEGLSVQRTGTAGPSQVRIRGSEPGHVLVLIDGQKINPSGSGVADLSGIPLDMVERIEIFKGGASAEFGPDALAGAINIITRPTKLFSNMAIDGKRGWGSWETKELEINLANPVNSKNYSSRWAYSKLQSEGNFDYAYSVDGVNGSDTTHYGTRINNRSESKNYFASGLFQLTSRLLFNYSGQYYRANRGLPDRATRQNEYASMNDRRVMATGSLIYELTADRKINLDFGYSQFKQLFLDNDPSNPLKYNSEFINDIFSVGHNHNYIIWNGSLVRSSIRYQRETFTHSDLQRPSMSMGKSIRNNLSSSASVEQLLNLSPLKVFDNLAIDGAIRFDHAGTIKDSTSYQDTVKTNRVDFWSPKFGLALSKGKNIAYILRAGYGKSFRLPTINALFWKGDVQSGGNPGLKPEKSEHSEVGAEFKLKSGSFDFSFGITYYHSFIKDLVVWSPNAQGVWKPANLALSQITGHEDFFKISILNEKIRLSYQNTIATALNKTAGHNQYGNRLTFAPHYTTVISAGFNLTPMYGSYSIRLVDRAYTNEANTRFYDAYRLDDARVGLEAGISRSWTLTAEVKVENIRDVNYVLITHYPMPGREWHFYLGINFRTDRSN